MSRGHGRVERNLLEAAQAGPVLFSEVVTRSEGGLDRVMTVARVDIRIAAIPRNTYESYRRAMRRLERDELISVQRHWWPQWDWLITRT